METTYIGIDCGLDGGIVASITPIGKPRMTQRDRWAKRKCVVAYYQFKDALRSQVVGRLPESPVSLSWVAYFPMPKSWSVKKQNAMRGQLHRQKPDRDNIDKAILDSLFSEDSGIASGFLEKRWDDGDGPRIEIFAS